MSEHLTPLDATFLELEEADESAHMHTGVIMVFDPQPDGGSPSREEVCRYLAGRLGQLPSGNPEHGDTGDHQHGR